MRHPKVYDRILITEQQLKKITTDMAQQLNAVYADTPDCLALVILEGAKYFANDLLAHLDFPLEVEQMKASSYLGGTQSTGTVQLEENEDLPQKIKGKNILIIDDIYDTGRTLAKLTDWAKDCGAADVKTCILLEKEIPHDEKITIDFLGTPVEDAFVIGYGLDYNNQYRDLPFIAELSDEYIDE